MFKKTKPTQVNMFKDIGAHYSEVKQKIFNDPNQWHNVFYRQVFCKIEETIFKPLYCLDNGRSNASVKVLVAMMVLKEGFGWSDKQLFMEARFNNLVMAALGLRNADQDIPVESTYYKFRSELLKYNEEEGVDLLDENFQHITIKQIEEFGVTGSKIRMDSKLINSNIARSSRLSLILNVIKKFIRKQTINELVKAGLTSSQYDFLVQLKNTKVGKICYSLDKTGKKTLLVELGEILSVLLNSYQKQEAHYDLLERIFNEQYELSSDENGSEEKVSQQDVLKENSSKEKISQQDDLKENSSKEKISKQENVKESSSKEKVSQQENVKKSGSKEQVSQQADVKESGSSKKTIRPKAGKTITATSLQSAHDVDAAYRSKGQGASKQQKNGFHSNITETCNAADDLNLITEVSSKGAHVCESKFLQKGVDQSEAMLKEAHHKKAAEQQKEPEQYVEQCITDGGYDDTDNRERMSGEDSPEWILAKTKGAKPAFMMRYNEEEKLEVYDIKTGEQLKTSRSKKDQVVVHQGKSRRYFTAEQIAQYILRQLYNKEISREAKGLRANCESTIHQVFHRLGKRDKIKYRGLPKCHWYVLCRALWVNFSRINQKVAKNALILINVWLRWLTGCYIGFINVGNIIGYAVVGQPSKIER